MASGFAVLPSSLKTLSASPSLSFGAESRGLSHSLSTLRSAGRPVATQDSLTNGCQPSGGVGTRWVRSRAFAWVFSDHASSFQALPGATSEMFKATDELARRI